MPPAFSIADALAGWLAYEALHPEARHGTAGAVGRFGNAVAKLASASFADDQASKTGQSKRAVERDAERGAKVCREALDILKGTKADTVPVSAVNDAPANLAVAGGAVTRFSVTPDVTPKA